MWSGNGDIHICFWDIDNVQYTSMYIYMSTVRILQTLFIYMKNLYANTNWTYSLINTILPIFETETTATIGKLLQRIKNMVQVLGT